MSTMYEIQHPQYKIGMPTVSYTPPSIVIPNHQPSWKAGTSGESWEPYIHKENIYKVNWSDIKESHILIKSEKKAVK